MLFPLSTLLLPIRKENRSLFFCLFTTMDNENLRVCEPEVAYPLFSIYN